MTITLLRHLPRFLLAEMRRELRLRLSYRLQALSSFLLWLVAFPLMMITFDGVAHDAAGGYGAEGQLASLIGFLVWRLCAGLPAAAAGDLVEEARQGTLESLFLSPLPPLLLVGGRMGAWLLRQLAETALLGLALLLLLDLSLPPSGAALLILTLTILGAAGAALALCGLALAHKQVESVAGILTLLAVLFTGALVPLNGLGPLFTALKLLVPTTWGIDLLRQALQNGAALSALWASGALPGLALQTALLLAGGAAAFRRGLRRAQRDGGLGDY